MFPEVKSMAHKTKDHAKKKEEVVTDVRLKPMGQVRLVPTEKPSEPPPEKRIHQRRFIPLVPEGPDKDNNPDD